MIFDVHGTLAESKSSLDGEIAILLGDLFIVVRASIILGEDWPRSEKQLLSSPRRERIQESLAYS
jgi:phosphomannomutase